MADSIEIICPCCEATLVADRSTGEVLLHRAKVVKRHGSLESMVSELESKKSEISKRFQKEMDSQKDRGRILDARFREALERADKSDTPMPNALDRD